MENRRRKADHQEEDAGRDNRITTDASGVSLRCAAVSGAGPRDLACRMPVFGDNAGSDFCNL
jgi:hypothetical protein